eukprot:scaffold3780_cov101-Isochrysis_galbana.AAC.3
MALEALAPNPNTGGDACPRCAVVGTPRATHGATDRSGDAGLSDWRLWLQHVYVHMQIGCGQEHTMLRVVKCNE